MPGAREPSEGPGPALRAGVALLALAGALQVLYGVAAVAGYSGLKESVEEIESNPTYGKLYLSLTGWGILLLVVGIATLWSAAALRRQHAYGRMCGLCGALIGLGLAFFTLAFFHEAALLTIVVTLVTVYVLSYLVEDPPGSQRAF